MIEASTTENRTAAKSPRPYADPAQFGALVARIDGDIEVLSRDRRNLALVRRNVLAICIVYAIAAFCVQDAIRNELSHTKHIVRNPAPHSAKRLVQTPAPVVPTPVRTMETLVTDVPTIPSVNNL